MKKLLHICAAPRGEKSRTLQVSSAFLETFKQSHPDWEMDTLDVFSESLPPINREATDGKYMLMAGGELTDQVKPVWREIERHIKRFLSADIYLLSTPMWNFSIPYPLKHYIDVIAQPKYLFRYTATGVEGLAKNKKMIVITSRGSDYSPGSPARPWDQQEPYLRTVFGFVGIADIAFIYAQPMDAAGPDVAAQKVAAAQNEARHLAETLQ